MKAVSNQMQSAVNERLPAGASLPLSFRSGDILAFGGSGCFSRAIRFWTLSPYSHVGIVCERADRPLLFESTTLSDLPCVLCGLHTRGVQAVYPDRRVGRYDGKIWWLRLAQPLEDSESARLLGFLLEQDGVEYDFRQVASAGRLGRFLWGSAEDQHRWFCSELVIASLKRVGRVGPNTSASAWRPSDVVRRLVQWGIYEQPVRVK